MEIKTIKVSEKGQVAIPISIREKLGIEQGDEMVLFVFNDKILLEKSKSIVEKMEDNFEDILRLSQDSLKEVWGNKEDDIWSSYLRK